MPISLIRLVVSGLATAIACGIVPEFVDFHKFKVVVILWLAFAALGDVIIAAALVTRLVSSLSHSRLRMRRGLIMLAMQRGQRTGFAATDDIIRKITRSEISWVFTWRVRH
jgi:hypothetical protein